MFLEMTKVMQTLTGLPFLSLYLNESISHQNVQYHYGATLLSIGMLFFTKPKLAALGHSNPFTRDQVTLIVTSTGH